MKYGNSASKKAQRKARRTIGPQGLVALETVSKGPDKFGCYKHSHTYTVGEFKGAGDYRIHGQSTESFRQAFEAAGIYEDAPKGTRT